MFIKSNGNWVDFRQLPGLVELDFHWSGEESRGSYWENMAQVREIAMNALVEAQNDGA